MYKTNGRKKKSTRESASNKGKKFYCTNCKVTKMIKDVEFGEEVFCEECGRTMEEC